MSLVDASPDGRRTRAASHRAPGGGGQAATASSSVPRRSSWRWGDPARTHPSAPVLWRVGVAWLGLVAVVGALGALVVGADGGEGWLTAGDRALEEVLGDPRPESLDSLVGPLTGLTDPFTVLGVAAAVLPLLAVLHHWRRLSVVVVAVLLELAVFLPVSLLLDRDRPPSAPLDAPFTGSFPSGHSAIAVAMWGGLAVVVGSLAGRRWVRWAALALAAVAALSAGSARLVLGYHHLSDVAAGWALGLACLVVGVRAANRLDVDEPRLEVRPRRAVLPPTGAGGTEASGAPSEVAGRTPGGVADHR